MCCGSERLPAASPERPGLNDYRAILHAHAEDSSHTGGTRPEMLAEAKQVGVHAILLTDHHRPPRDFITQSWRRIEGRRPLHAGVRGSRVPALSHALRSWTTWPTRFPGSSRPYGPMEA